MNIVFEKSVAFTGHRPHRLFGYDYKIEGNRKILLKARAIIERLIDRRGINTFISGMALGIDMWLAQVVLSLREKYPHIKLVCAIPCKEQYKKWNEDDTNIYHEILAQADYVHYVSEEAYTNWCMVDRDKWMVDNARMVVAVWNEEENGGTWQTVKYARKRQRNIIRLHPKTLKVILE